MSPDKKLIAKVRELLYSKGQESLEIARQSILREEVPYELLHEALRFFILDWEDVLHPALLAFSCEAVGGKAEATAQVGAALVLLAGGADVHDHVIDTY